MTHADWPKDVVGPHGASKRTSTFHFWWTWCAESALAASRVVLDDDQWMVEGAHDTDEDTDFHFDISLEEVPIEWLELCRWNVSGCGRWNRCEDVIILEAIAWMKCVERLCKGVYGTKCRQLVLGGNMVLVLTECRWRSRHFKLIVILRQAAAYILARDMVIVSRWIMSEMNTSDVPSRLTRTAPATGPGYATD